MSCYELLIQKLKLKFSQIEKKIDQMCEFLIFIIRIQFIRGIGEKVLVKIIIDYLKTKICVSKKSTQF